ncbi:acyl-CoA synthetase [Rhodospirillum centenum]|uniref:3-methylmercaptopropionyl-CoA ligase n=1 Tax=Rhodospirillum centenum (strain ATCC 51521 / SW) TaxID=414684 RepID=B6IX60_RHOCS|nr:long-chain fatty acid--CoA ligase [Rhodospirillum centenum]ACJ00884.1 acyl-CoA synthetase, putative [Rhodospirillum centenum SW]
MTLDLFDITAKRAALRPDRCALEELETGFRLTYRGLEDRCARAAAVLADEGVGEGDRVAVLCRNRIDFFVLLFAVAKLGAILVPLNWRMPAAELKPLLADCTPRRVVAGQEDMATAAAASGTPPLGLDDPGPHGFAARLAAAVPHPGRERWPGGQVWYLIYTSGTTGRPKAVIYTYAMALVNYVNIGQAIDLRGDDRTLNFLPLFHTAGINLHTLPTLIAGGTVMILPGFDADAMIGLLAAGRLDTFFGVPAVYQQLGLHPAFDTVDPARVRSWGCGGAPLPDALAERFFARGVRVCNGMGMTETGPTAFLVDPADAPRKIGSVGKPQLLCAVRIVGPDGRDVPPGETGELWFSGPGVTPGYWNRPDATAAAFAPGGWLRSGDLARCDADGYYYIVGRLKEMFISGGENVYPAEVENVLVRHPAVLEAAVTGVPDDRWGEVGRAFLMLRPGCAPPDPGDLAAWCRERLAAYKVPKSFVFLDDFPRTAAGKVQKHRLHDAGGKS